MKKLLVFLVMLMVLSLAGYKKTVTLHFDDCDKEVQANAKMGKSWIVFCKDYEPEIDIDEK